MFVASSVSDMLEPVKRFLPILVLQLVWIEAAPAVLACGLATSQECMLALAPGCLQ